QRAETFLQAMVGQILYEPAREVLSTQGVLRHFTGVYAVDSTLLDKTHKLMTRLELSSGQVSLELGARQTHDNRLSLAAAPLPAGALRLTDLGFFDLTTFGDYDRAQVYWLSRYKARTQVYLLDSTAPLDMTTFLAEHDTLYCPVRVGCD